MTGYFLLSRFRKRDNPQEKKTQRETHKRCLKQKDSVVMVNLKKLHIEHK